MINTEISIGIPLTETIIIKPNLKPNLKVFISKILTFIIFYFILLTSINMYLIYNKFINILYNNNNFVLIKLSLLLLINYLIIICLRKNNIYILYLLLTVFFLNISIIITILIIIYKYNTLIIILISNLIYILLILTYSIISYFTNFQFNSVSAFCIALSFNILIMHILKIIFNFHLFDFVISIIISMLINIYILYDIISQYNSNNSIIFKNTIYPCINLLIDIFNINININKFNCNYFTNDIN